jgi:hypothetical protein
MQAINWTSPTVWKTEPCPVTGSDHGPLDLYPDDNDSEKLAVNVTCQSCSRTATAGWNDDEGKIDLFYEWGRSDPNTGDNFIWGDSAGTEHPHTKPPVFQTSGPFKGQLWWVP